MIREWKRNVGLLLLAGLSFGIPMLGLDQEPQTAPDNTKQNKAAQTTAEQQSNDSSDLLLTKNVRRALVQDKSLSTYAHNVKIVAQGGKVTLSGPVKSDDEKQAIAAKAAEVAGQGNVVNELTVAPQ